MTATEGGQGRGRPLGNGETDKAALKVRAYNLHVGEDPEYYGVRHTKAEVARILGIAPNTAGRYIDGGYQGAQWITHIERNQARTTIAAIIHQCWGFITEAAELADAKAREETGDANAVADKTHLVGPAMKVADRLAKLSGADAPTRVQNEEVPHQMGPSDQDQVIAEALIRERERNEPRKRAIEQGRKTNGDR